MKLRADRELHLSYCTNIHAAETWPEVMKNLETYVLAVRARVAEKRRFGLGLRLSAQAAAALDTPEELARFRGFLDAHELYVFTINGFPYGPFHGTRVKEDVYLPDWLEDERVAYSNRLASLLAELLSPNDAGEGSVSTVPGAFKARVSGEADAALLGENMLRHLAHLHHLREERGRKISLALEPEPACHFETVAETIDFFERRLFSRAASARFAELAGLDVSSAEAFAREHIGVCFDACHMAVEMEEPGAALDAFRRAGIRIPKFQISAGLEVELGRNDGEMLRELEPFAEGVYLHQVVERAEGRLSRFVDLPQAMAAARANTGGAIERLWRIHFHVPIFRDRLGPFANTQRDLASLLALIRDDSPAPHLEVETYCWDVLPEEHKQGGIVAAVARELEWVLERIAS